MHTVGSTDRFTDRRELPQRHQMDCTADPPGLPSVVSPAAPKSHCVVQEVDATAVSWPFAEMSEVCSTDVNLPRLPAMSLCIARGRCHLANAMVRA